MSFRPLTDSPRQSNDCDVVATQLKGHSDTVGRACAGNEDTIEQLLDSARNGSHTTAWVVYRAGEHMHLVGQGDPRVRWPSIVVNEEFEAFCLTRRLHRWPTGRGETVLGWLLAPVNDAAEPALAAFARRLASRYRPIPLPVRRLLSVCCMKLPTWPVRPATGQCFWWGFTNCWRA